MLDHTSAACHLHGGGVVLFVIVTGGVSHVSVASHIYKVYLSFGRMEKFLSDNGTRFINEHWRNLAKALSFTHIQSSARNPRASKIYTTSRKEQ